MIISILKVMVVLVILAMMILLLVSVDHFLAGSFDCSDEDIDALRHDINDTTDVISDHSSFSQLVEKPVKNNSDRFGDHIDFQ